MTAPAGVRHVRPLGAPPCRLDPQRWEVPGASEHQIRKAASLCARCPIRETYCANIPASVRPRGMVLGGYVVAAKDGKLHHPDAYLRFIRSTDRPESRADAEKQYLHGIDLSEVDPGPERLREILRGEIDPPARMNQKTRWLAIAIAVAEMHLGDTEIAHILLSTGGKPQPESIRRTRVHKLGLPVRGGAPEEQSEPCPSANTAEPARPRRNDPEATSASSAPVARSSPTSSARTRTGGTGERHHRGRGGLGRAAR